MRPSLILHFCYHLRSCLFAIASAEMIPCLGIALESAALSDLVTATGMRGAATGTATEVAIVSVSVTESVSVIVIKKGKEIVTETASVIMIKTGKENVSAPKPQWSPRTRKSFQRLFLGPFPLMAHSRSTRRKCRPRSIPSRLSPFYVGRAMF